MAETVKVNLSRTALVPQDANDPNSPVVEYQAGQQVEMPMGHAEMLGYDASSPDASIGSVEQIRNVRQAKQQQKQNANLLTALQGAVQTAQGTQGTQQPTNTAGATTEGAGADSGIAEVPVDEEDDSGSEGSDSNGEGSEVQEPDTSPPTTPENAGQKSSKKKG